MHGPALVEPCRPGHCGVIGLLTGRISAGGVAARGRSPRWLLRPRRCGPAPLRTGRLVVAPQSLRITSTRSAIRVRGQSYEPVAGRTRWSVNTGSLAGASAKRSDAFGSFAVRLGNCFLIGGRFASAGPHGLWRSLVAAPRSHQMGHGFRIPSTPPSSNATARIRGGWGREGGGGGGGGGLSVSHGRRFLMRHPADLVMPRRASTQMRQAVSSGDLCASSAGIPSQLRTVASADSRSRPGILVAGIGRGSPS